MIDDDLELQDAAAELYDQGLSWVDVARELDLPIEVAKTAAQQALRRSRERAERDQIALF
ncbi:hypothetical protein FOV72_19675 [Gordonia rubripertincta]|uniref:hypothetical protein n=1 Tax=Gordonia rubripertincta TaxID=36822 RepID=UPI0011806E96|nr:hypothetical protein [Gordonia rubripertincta]TSD93482.1 hypothetical protein FOV72_19675 [Gordonia rubripertincta]